MTTAQADTPSTKPQHGGAWFRVIALLVIAGLLMWHFDVFKSKTRVAIVTSSDTPYWDMVIDGANEAARTYDVKLTVIKSKPDLEAQTQAIRDLINDHYDGIAVSPISPMTQAMLLMEVANGTTLVTFDSDSPVSRRLCFVGTDNYAAGRRAGACVKQALPKGGDVIISIGNLDKENAQRRRQGVIDELLDRSFEPDREIDPADAALKGAQYNIVATVIDGANPQAATDLAAQALKANPNAKCLVGLNAYSAPALEKALEQSQQLGKIQIVGFDVPEETLDGIKAGNIFATIMQDQKGCGFQTVRILAENAQGNHVGLPLFQRRTLPIEVVTNENLAAIREELSKDHPTTQPGG